MLLGWCIHPAIRLSCFGLDLPRDCIAHHTRLPCSGVHRGIEPLAYLCWGLANSFGKSSLTACFLDEQGKFFAASNVDRLHLVSI